jgi:hypothetical protein
MRVEVQSRESLALIILKVHGIWSKRMLNSIFEERVQNKCGVFWLYIIIITNGGREKSRYLDLELSGGSKRAYLNLFSPEADRPYNTRLSAEAKIDRLFSYNCSI